MGRRWGWLPFAGAAVGIAVLGVRLATLPFDQGGPFLVALAVAVALTIGIFAGLGLSRRRRMRAARELFPDAFLIPIVVGTDTAVASRWLAEHLGDSALRLPSEQNAVIAADAAGLHVLASSRPPFGVLPAASLSHRGIQRVRVGARRIDALAVGVQVGDAIAPLPLVPIRSSVFQLGSLTDAELHDVLGRLEDALAGRPTAPGWRY